MEKTWTSVDAEEKKIGEGSYTPCSGNSQGRLKRLVVATETLRGEKIEKGGGREKTDQKMTVKKVPNWMRIYASEV